MPRSRSSSPRPSRRSSRASTAGTSALPLARHRRAPRPLRRRARGPCRASVAATPPRAESTTLLSWLIGLPLAGAVAILFLPRQAPRVLRGVTMLVMFATIALTIPLLNVTMGRGFHFNQDVPWMASPRHPLPRRDRRHHALARDAHGAPAAGGGVGVVRLDPDAREGLVLRAPPARGGDARRVPLARSVPLLRVLGADARPHVRHDRRLGRGEPHQERDQVLPLHDVRQRPDARRHPLPRVRVRARLADEHAVVRLLRAAAARAPAARAGLALRGVRAGVLHQGPDVAGAHVAARRAHRGAHRRLDHPGRRHAEDGDLRVPALLHGPLPRGGVDPRRRRSPASPSSAGSSTARSARGSRTT